MGLDDVSAPCDSLLMSMSLRIRRLIRLLACRFDREPVAKLTCRTRQMPAVTMSDLVYGKDA